MSLIILWVIA